LLIIQFIYNVIPQEKIGILPFKENYGYKLKISLSPKQVKKSSKIAKKKSKNSYKPSQESLGNNNIHTRTHKKVL
jgi:hypothetical protein